MEYRVLNLDIGKNLFYLKKYGKELTDKQKNYYYLKSRDINHDGSIADIVKKCKPNNFSECYVMFQSFSYWRKSGIIVHVFYLDDKSIKKYVKLNSCNDIVDYQNYVI